MTAPPGSTIGIIGGGQLGRMMALAAANLGYRCHIFDPHAAPCAASVSAAFTRAAFDDEAALETFAAACDVVTYEFENVPVAPLSVIGDKLRPGTRSLECAQDRAVEKQFLESIGTRVAPWRMVDSAADAAAAETLGLPLVFKTRRLGYDGKGQAWVRDTGFGAQAFAAIGQSPAVAELAIDFEAEFSVVVARGLDGQIMTWDPPRNRHENGILRRSTVPGGDPVERQAADGRAIAAKVAEALGHIGVLTVEFFATNEGPLVNEFAPRVHNSGHWTIEGAHTSQFEQHVRAICGLPLGPTGLVGAGAEMTNLIGDEVADWRAPLERGEHFHDYGKGDARPGRKMGHVTRIW